MNEYSVGLCESTCRSKFNSSHGDGNNGILNIVDLSQLALERSKTALEAVETMGELAEKYGYHDAGESMLVVDSNSSWIFHVLPDDSGAGAIWVAQRVMGSEMATVANAFIIQDVVFPLDGSTLFLGSSNLKPIAEKHGWYDSSDPSFNFAYIYSWGELGPKYNTGRRMWHSFMLLSPTQTFSSTYDQFLPHRTKQGQPLIPAPYPTTISVRPNSIAAQDLFTVMRSFYNNTKYDLTNGLASGPFGNPFRAHLGKGAMAFPSGRWERPIATWKTQVSYIVTPCNGFVWFAPHAAHTASYLPFHVTLPITSSVEGPVSIDTVNRSTAFWSNRWMFHLSQLNFNRAYIDINAKRDIIERNSFALVEKYQHTVQSHPVTVTQVMNANANVVIAQWNALCDSIIVKYGEGNCNGCQAGVPRHLGYPAWWLKDVGFSNPMPTGEVVKEGGKHVEQKKNMEKVVKKAGDKQVEQKKNVEKAVDTRLNVLITGATGRTGTALYTQLKRFASSSFKIRGLVRNVSKARERLGCDKCDESEGIYVADVTKIKTLGPAFKTANVVVIITGSYPNQLPNGSFVYPKGGTPREVDYLGTNNQVITAVQSTTVTRIVLVSSMGTTDPSSFLNLLGNGYGLSYKLNAEVYLMQQTMEYVMASSRASSLSSSSSSQFDYTIVKPSGLLSAVPGGGGGGGGTNASYLIGHSDRLRCLECMNISRSDLANVLQHVVLNLDLFKNARFDLSSNPGVLVSDRDWNILSTQAGDVSYPQP